MNNYTIITLGPSGAGKTVFLASLFKLLSIQGEHGFFLEVEDAKKQNILNNTYSEVISKETWPKGTRGEVTKWTFTCCVKAADLSKHSACQFTYFDYAGGLLTDTEAEEEDDNCFDFQQEIKKADAVLAIIDGLKTFSFMQDSDLANSDVLVWLQRDLTNLMQLVDKCEKHTPVHFIISKWDLLESSYSLLQVRNRLLEKVPEFNKVVRNRNNAGCPIRLIPVSSVGMGFATLQPDGQMKKKPGAIPRPFQVEVPLACVLIDGVESQIIKLKAEQEKIIRLPTKVKTNLSILDQVDRVWSKTFIALSTAVIRPFLPDKYKITNDALQKLLDFAEKGVQHIEEKAQIKQEQISKKEEEAAQETERLMRLQAESLKKVKDEETALNHAVNSFLNIRQKLIKDFPASDLGGAGV
ncbi:hypothetical protein [Floridanema evergladense]|uniref:Uncharacterized protein n=1 Tax=Floridaenema evergladense BLCC-F167 TaxID=3153639 RepID=A0ABV4WNL8_9CYAN